MALGFEHEKILTRLQSEFVSRALSDRYFSEASAPVPVISELKGDIANEIERALGTVTDVDSSGKIGTCVVIMSPVASVQTPNLSQGPLTSEWEFRVLEDALLNGSDNGIQKSALWTARRLVRLFHQFTPFGLAQVMTARSPAIVPVEDPLAPIAYAVRFLITEGETLQEQKVKLPTITAASGGYPKEITLACETAGAAIYYTLDGTYPYEGNPDAELYSGTFNIAEAATIRAAAFAADMLPSSVNLLTA